MVIEWWLNGDLMMFNGDLMVINSDLMVINSNLIDLMVISGE